MRFTVANRIRYFHIGNSHTVSGTQLIPRLLGIHSSVAACTTVDDPFGKTTPDLLAICVQSFPLLWWSMCRRVSDQSAEQGSWQLQLHDQLAHEAVLSLLSWELWLERLRWFSSFICDRER